MTVHVAPPKATGGGGFVFEDKVVAWFIAHFLAVEAPLGVRLGQLARLDFQTSAEGWLLDDCLVTLSHPAGPRRCAFSIKSNAQFGPRSAPRDFVADIWKQRLHEGSTCFDDTTDYLGIATARHAGTVGADASFVLHAARTGDPKLLPGRFANPDWASASRHALFQSFHCPADLAGQHGVVEEDTASLLALVRFIEFDFDDSVSKDKTNCIQRCRRALWSKSPEEAENLWNALVSMAADRRPVAGHLTRLDVLDELRGRFRLVDFPDHDQDWRRLESLSKSAWRCVRDGIGGEVRIERDEPGRSIRAAMEGSPGVVMVGRSGVGKSAVARALAESRRADGGRSIWFDAASFERLDFAEFEHDLKIQHGLSELFTEESGAQPLVVLDGLGRLHDPRSLRIVAALLQALDLDRGGCPWRVLVTCQSAEWDRFRGALAREGRSLETWPVVECEAIAVEALAPVWDRFPRLRRLQFEPRVRPLLSNLKILDLVASRHATRVDADASGWVGESGVGRWFWEAVVVSGGDALPRARFAQLLAEKQAEKLRVALPVGDFEVADLAPVDGLVRDRVCRRSGDGRIAFEHDLLGDWARTRVLMSRTGELETFLQGRLDSPLWHRAVRLYGIHLLEDSGDVRSWRDAVDSLTVALGAAAGDLLIEALAFAADPSSLLDLAHADLLADEGALLRRLLARFLVFATTPDPKVVEFLNAAGLDSAAASVAHRIPIWSYWPPVLRFLAGRADEAAKAAPLAVARIARLWLDHTPPKTALRVEAARLGLVVGELVNRHRRSGTVVGRGESSGCFAAALAGARELPDEIALFALRLAERIEGPADEAEVVATPADPSRVPADGWRSRQFDPDEPIPDPWEDGPARPVDRAFQTAVLEGAPLIPLVEACPAVAREVLLAVLLNAPKRRHWGEGPFGQGDLDLDTGLQWHPALYSHGPFLAFLERDFDEGLEVIARLVDFATDRWRYYAAVEAEQNEARVDRADDDPAVRSLLGPAWNRPSARLVVRVGDVNREYAGDERVYGWSGGQGWIPPSLVQVALMALEQHLYLGLKRGIDIGARVAQVLERVRSTAFLRVLCDVGKKEPALFEGPLSPLLGVPELYFWDELPMFKDRSHLLIGAHDLQGPGFVRLAEEFGSLEHRARDLRGIAVGMLLHDRPGIRALFAEAVTRWTHRLSADTDDPLPNFLERLVAQFTLEAYEEDELPQHGRVWVNRHLVELGEADAEERLRWERARFIELLPVRCRRMLDEGTSFPAETLEEIWELLQQLSGSGYGDGEPDAMPGEDQPAERVPPGLVPPIDAETRANALAGAAAVLLRLHSEWVAEDPSRHGWCVAQLRLAMHDPPPMAGWDVPDSVCMWTWDCFAAEALPRLWAAEPQDADLRDFVGRLVFAPQYGAVRILLVRCAEHRERLGKDFDQLRRLLFEWAHVRHRQQFVERDARGARRLTEQQALDFDAEVVSWHAERLQSFVDGDLPALEEDWRLMDQRRRFSALDELRFRCRGEWYLDYRLVLEGHAWIPPLGTVSGAAERSELLAFWRQALEFSLARLDFDDDDRQQAYKEDLSILSGVARLVLDMQPEEAPEDLWQPILTLPAGCTFWLETFLRAFYENALARDPVPDSLVRLRVTMADYIFGRADDRMALPCWGRFGDPWPLLFGADGSTNHLWQSRHGDLVKQGTRQLEKWMAKAGLHGRHLGAVARWLELEAARSVRLPALGWLADALLPTTGSDSYRLGACRA